MTFIYREAFKNIITCELIIMFAVGIFLLAVAAIQLYTGKVYTRGRRGFQWHKKIIVTKEEAPFIFRLIITMQFLAGITLIVITCIEIYYRMQNFI